MTRSGGSSAASSLQLAQEEANIPVTVIGDPGDGVVTEGEVAQQSGENPLRLDAAVFVFIKAVALLLQEADGYRVVVA